MANSERNSISKCHLQRRVSITRPWHCTLGRHCRFLVPGNTQKNFAEIWHQFWNNNYGANICHWNYTNPLVNVDSFKNLLCMDFKIILCLDFKSCLDFSILSWISKVFFGWISKVFLLLIQFRVRLLTETCYYWKNQVFGGATNWDTSLIETCFYSKLYGLLDKKWW